MSLTFLDTPELRRRALTIKILAGAAVTVIGGWAALGLPIGATQSYVQAQIAPVKIDGLEARSDIAELRLFLLDWTVRQSSLDAQARALVEAERSRVAKSAASINARLELARAAR